jgi:hypothetical protein
MSIEFHRAAIAFHQSEIDKLSGVPTASGFDPNDWRTWWPAMLVQFDNEEKPRPWVDWASGVLPDQTGNNIDPPPMYEGAKPFWQQMERQIPQVMDSRGVRFNALTCARRGGWSDFEDEVRRLWNGPEGEAWRAAPENADRVDKIKV